MPPPHAPRRAPGSARDAPRDPTTRSRPPRRAPATSAPGTGPTPERLAIEQLLHDVFSFLPRVRNRVGRAGSVLAWVVGLEPVNVDGGAGLEAARKRPRERVRAGEGCYRKGTIPPWTRLAYLGSSLVRNITRSPTCCHPPGSRAASGLCSLLRRIQQRSHLLPQGLQPLSPRLPGDLQIGEGQLTRKAQILPLMENGVRSPRSVEADSEDSESQPHIPVDHWHLVSCIFFPLIFHLTLYIVVHEYTRQTARDCM